MAVDQKVLHNLIVTGVSQKSFDDAVRNAIEGAWINHGKEFERFVTFKASAFEGEIETPPHGKPAAIKVWYHATVAIGAIHAEHHHDHGGDH